MAHKTRRGIAFRVAISAYAFAVLAWLLLGLLPVLADNVGAVHHVLVSAAGHRSAVGRMAARILHPDTMADVTTGAQTGVQYLFSALNLTLGVLLVTRRPDETVPRLLGFALLGTAATFNLPSHRTFHITGNPWPIASTHFTFHIVSGVAYVWAVVLFPDARMPSQLRLGPKGTAACAIIFTALVALVCWRRGFLAHPQFFVVFFGVAVPLAGIGAQALRLRSRHTTVAERRTARMLCAALLPAFVAALLWCLARLAGGLGSGSSGRAAARFATQVSTGFPLVFAVVPVVLFAAVLRYRLWELDRWLTRVLVYGLLALVIGAGYVCAVVIGARLAGPGPLWIMVLTLSVAAAAAQPLRTRARRWANRVVFGVSLSPRDALRTLSDGLAQLTVTDELQRLVSVTVQASRASSATLWLVDGSALVAAVSAPRGGALVSHPVDGDVSLTDMSLTDMAQRLDADCCHPVHHQGELLGVLGVAGRDLTRRDHAIIADIADHAGLLVHNAVLTVGLARQADRSAALALRLRHARRHLVAAQDAERRRLERNLHDGAQQALVAALIGARTVDPHRGDAPDRVASLRGVLAIARASLADLTGARYPAVLDEIGLIGAVERAAELTRRLGIEVTVTADIDEERVGPDVAVAVYFCCLEGLQNVAKYAGACAVLVELREVEDELRFAVTDDGAGFDPAKITDAGGLKHLDGRLAAVGGTLTVRTGSTGGTRLAGRAPCRARVLQ